MPEINLSQENVELKYDGNENTVTIIYEDRELIQMLVLPLDEYNRLKRMMELMDRGMSAVDGYEPQRL